MIKGNGYEINNKNLINHELIGLKVRVVKSTDHNREGTIGKIIDETKNTIILENGKILPKKECVFEFDINEKIVVDGKDFIKKPEYRLK